MTDGPVPQTSVLRQVRESHEERVLAVLRSHGAQSRAELGRRTGLSRATLYAIIRHLVGTDAVVELEADRASARGRGRPATQLTLNPAAGLALGLDLGHRRIHVAIANVAHEVIAMDSESCAERTSWTKRIDLALRLVDRVAERMEISLAALTGVGAGVVGPVFRAGGSSQPQADRAERVHDSLAAHFEVPVHVDNNTRLAALAEAIWGSAAGVENVLYVRLSYGVGGGLVLGGYLFSGAAGGAGEFGHVSVDPDGPDCACGGRGCLERYVSLGAVLEQCGCRHLAEIGERLEAGDRQVHEVVASAGERLGRVLAATCNVLNPDAVVIGGELSAVGEPLLEPVRRTINDFTHRLVRRELRVHTAALGDGGAARGGIALALHRSALLTGYPM